MTTSDEPDRKPTGYERVLRARTQFLNEEQHHNRDARRAERRLAGERLALLAVVLVGSAIGMALAAAGPAGGLYAVATGSMEPALPRGALALATPGTPAVGDIIVFQAPNGEVVVHRVVEVREGPAYSTRGDANQATDSALVPPEQVRGVVHGHVPYVGYLWIAPGIATFVLFLAALLGYLAITAFDARHALRSVQPTVHVVYLVVLGVLIPGAFAAVLINPYPLSGHTAQVAATPIPLAAGTMGSAAIGADQNTADVTTAAPRLWKEVVLWGCTSAGACTFSAPTSYASQPGTQARVDMADYAPDPSAYLEAYLAAPSGQTIFARLYDATNGAAVAGSELSTTSTTPTLVRVGPFSLSGAAEYEVQTKNSGSSSGGAVSMVKLLLVHDFPSATETQVRVASGSTTNTFLSFVTPTGAFPWRYDGAATDGVTGAYFEVVASHTLILSGSVRLVDVTASTVVVTLTVSATSSTRVRSSFATSALVDGHEYSVEFQAGAGTTLDLDIARVGILQSSFAESVRYATLSWPASTTSTSFAEVGHRAAYFSASEWGGTQGYFEAVLAGSAGGVTATANLRDVTGAADVAGTSVAVTGTTPTRSRSALFDLSPIDSTYAAQLKTTSGTASLRNAWIIVFQTPAKTFDSVLKAQNTIVNACTWNFVLASTSSSNLARISSATISIRGDSGLASQIIVDSGSITQSSGSSVPVAYGNAAAFVVVTQPSSAGSSTINAELRGQCGATGVRAVQYVNFLLT